MVSQTSLTFVVRQATHDNKSEHVFTQKNPPSRASQGSSQKGLSRASKHTARGSAGCVLDHDARRALGSVASTSVSVGLDAGDVPHALQE
jgi:hypothetical protein